MSSLPIEINTAWILGKLPLRIFSSIELKNIVEALCSNILHLACFAAVLLLQSAQEITQNLILTRSVLVLRRLAEKGAQFVLADLSVNAFKDIQYIGILHVQRNLDFTKNDVVVQLFLWLGLLAFFLPSFVVDESVQESSQFNVLHLDKGGLQILFEPVAHFGAGYGVIGLCEEVDHFGVVVVEGVSYSAEDVVVGHRVFLFFCENRQLELKN